MLKIFRTIHERSHRNILQSSRIPLAYFSFKRGDAPFQMQQLKAYTDAVTTAPIVINRAGWRWRRGRNRAKSA